MTLPLSISKFSRRGRQLAGCHWFKTFAHDAIHLSSKRSYQLSEPFDSKRLSHPFTIMAVLFRLRLGDKILRFRRGKCYSARLIRPKIERGPFGCWLASWKWGQVGWELKRWTE